LFLYSQRIFSQLSVSNGYALHRKNPLQIKARPVCLPARCAQAGVRYAQAGAIITAIHELSGLATGLFSAAAKIKAPGIGP